MHRASSVCRFTMRSGDSALCSVQLPSFALCVQGSAITFPFHHFKVVDSCLDSDTISPTFHLHTMLGSWLWLLLAVGMISSIQKLQSPWFWFPWGRRRMRSHEDNKAGLHSPCDFPSVSSVFLIIQVRNHSACDPCSLGKEDMATPQQSGAGPCTDSGFQSQPLSDHLLLPPRGVTW